MWENTSHIWVNWALTQAEVSSTWDGNSGIKIAFPSSENQDF